MTRNFAALKIGALLAANFTTRLSSSHFCILNIFTAKFVPSDHSSAIAYPEHIDVHTCQRHITIDRGLANRWFDLADIECVNFVLNYHLQSNEAWCSDE